MGYRFPVNTVTQKRLAQVIGDRKKEEEKYQPLMPDIPLSPLQDASKIPFSDTLGGAGMPGLGIPQSSGQPITQQPRRTSSNVTSTGQPRLTNRQKSGDISMDVVDTRRTDGPVINMHQLKIEDPLKHQELLGSVHDTASSPSDRYNLREVIQQGNVAGADPTHLTVGSHQTPNGKVPLDGKNSKIVSVLILGSESQTLL